MMKFKIEKKVVVEEEVDVDDRIYKTDSIEWRIADVFLACHLDDFSADLFKEDELVVRDAADKINAAFRKADQCLALVRSGKYEI